MNLANYLLVVVGLCGIGTAVWTLCYVRKQAKEMALQRHVLRETLEAIKEQAALMREQGESAKNKERPRLRVEFDYVSLKADSCGDFVVPIVVSRYGSTEAFIESQWCFAVIGDSNGYEIPIYKFPLNLPQVIESGVKPFNTEAYFVTQQAA